MRMVKEQTYDLVVANPPYQGTNKLLATEYIDQNYPAGKADLFAAFILRGLQLVRHGGFAIDADHEKAGCSFGSISNCESRF